MCQHPSRESQPLESGSSLHFAAALICKLFDDARSEICFDRAPVVGIAILPGVGLGEYPKLLDDEAKEIPDSFARRFAGTLRLRAFASSAACLNAISAYGYRAET